MKRQVAGTRTRISQLIYTVPETENDTYDRACFEFGRLTLVTVAAVTAAAQRQGQSQRRRRPPVTAAPPLRRWETAQPMRQPAPPPEATADGRAAPSTRRRRRRQSRGSPPPRAPGAARAVKREISGWMRCFTRDRSEARGQQPLTPPRVPLSRRPGGTPPPTQ